MYYLLQLKIIKVLAIHINSGFKVIAIYLSEQTFEGHDDIVWEEWSVLGHSLLQGWHLAH